MTNGNITVLAFIKKTLKLNSFPNISYNTTKRRWCWRDILTFTYHIDAKWMGEERWNLKNHRQWNIYGKQWRPSYFSTCGEIYFPREYKEKLFTTNMGNLLLNMHANNFNQIYVSTLSCMSRGTCVGIWHWYMVSGLANP